MNYPVFDAGWMMAPRGFGTMLAMFLVARMINRVDNRLFILVGFLLTAALVVADDRVFAADGVGADPLPPGLPRVRARLHLVPLNLLALSGLPHHILTQGTAIRALMRMLGGASASPSSRRSSRRTPRSCIPAWSRGCGPTTRWRSRRSSARRSV